MRWTRCYANRVKSPNLVILSNENLNDSKNSPRTATLRLYTRSVMDLGVNNGSLVGPCKTRQRYHSHSMQDGATQLRANRGLLEIPKPITLRVYAGIESLKWGENSDSKVTEFLSIDVKTVARGAKAE